MTLGIREPPPATGHAATHRLPRRLPPGPRPEGARQPRDLLRAIDGVELVEPAEWELCCGSAGTYNVEKPETAASLGARKATNLLDTGATLIATGNIGCMTQVQAHLHAQGRDIPVLHTLQVLDRAYAQTLKETP